MSPTEVRLKLLQAGFLPIPCRGKRPAIAEWSHKHADVAEITSWSQDPEIADARNTGLLTEQTPLVDVDVYDAEVAQDVETIIEGIVGEQLIARIGQHPKRGFLFRCAVPFRKLHTGEWISPDGVANHCEILAYGQQFIAYGRHPVTGQDYEWRTADPLSIELNELPLLTENKAREIINAICELFASVGWREEKPPIAEPPPRKNNDAAHSVGTRGEKFAQAALIGLAADVANAPEHTRNNTLNSAAFRLGRMVGAGWTTRDEAEAALIDAALRCGLGIREAKATFASGISAGQKNPRDGLPEREARVSENGDNVTPVPSPPEAPPPPKLVTDNIAWDGMPVPEQRWTVHERIPAQQVCILSGHGSTGKSMIGLHLAAAHAAPRNDWLKAIVQPGPSLFLDAEETIEQIHIRLCPITELFDCSYQDLINGGLAVKTLVDNAIMATVDRNGVVVPTTLYKQVLEYAGDLKTVQVIIANAANVFAGNENDRSEVQQFVGLLKRIALVSGGSVVLITHPSLTGLATDTGLSGSTQWHNAVRARMWLHGVKANEGADKQESNDLRVLEFMKNQYGPLGESITLRWQNGMFRPEPSIASMDKLARENSLDEVFLAILRRFQNTGRPHVSENLGSTYAPKKFLGEAEARAIRATVKELDGAMRRLLHSGKIVSGKHGRGDSKRHHLECRN